MLWDCLTKVSGTLETFLPLTLLYRVISVCHASVFWSPPIDFLSYLDHHLGLPWMCHSLSDFESHFSWLPWLLAFHVQRQEVQWHTYTCLRKRVFAIFKYFPPTVSPSRSFGSKRFSTSSSLSSSITFLETESLMLSLSTCNSNGSTLHAATFLMSLIVWTQTLWPNQEFRFKGWYQTKSPFS